MKRKLYTLLSGAALAVMTMLAGCADLGFGVDVDPDDVSPYWYGNGYLGNYYWDTPVWNYGPIYRPVPPRPNRPPMLNPGVGPVILPDNRPVSKPENTFPGINTIPTTVNGVERPGNAGLGSNYGSGARSR